MQRAANAGAISPDEAGDLFETDIIISAEGNRHVAVEVSLTSADGEVTPAIVTPYVSVVALTRG